LVAQVTPTTIRARGVETREINRAIRRAAAEGAADVHVADPAGRHSLAVALTAEDLRVVIEGPTGWYTAGMNDGPHVVIQGNTGWAVAECMMRGRIEVHGHAGSGAAASIRGGLVFVEGDTGARAGISMKGGTLVVGGSVGYMSGFMMQAGTIIVCGDASDAIGDSMYDGTIYVGGRITSRGADAEIAELTDDDRAVLEATLADVGLEAGARTFTKIRSGRRLWNFSTKEPELWASAL
jgi:methylamine---glutamate N-methyltransferase subunit B